MSAQKKTYTITTYDEYKNLIGSDLREVGEIIVEQAKMDLGEYAYIIRSLLRFRNNGFGILNFSLIYNNKF